MKGERKLSLVRAPSSHGKGEALPPGFAGTPHPTGDENRADVEMSAVEAEIDLEPTPEELREAEALRRAMERGDDPTAEALRAAYEPAALDGEDLEAILARAMGDADAPTTKAEQVEVDRLRVTLDEHDALRSGKVVAGPGARTAPPHDSTASAAVALRAAWAPSPIGVARNDALVSRALDAASSKSAADRAAPARKGGASNDAPAPISLRRFRIGARTIATMTAVVAMAAGVLFMVGRFGTQSAPSPASQMAQAPAAASVAPVAANAPGEPASPAGPTPRIAARSTQELFDAATPFPRSGGESERVDRIASARAADLRANRFAAWGVR